ncbi:MAG: hypothetical protein ACJAWO_002003 [Halieaceae bacterium]|jgi:hypothetical protein
MNWLVGSWTRQYNEVTQVEIWTATGDSITGASYFVQENDSTLMSSYQIVPDNNEIRLFTQEMGFESKVEYQLTYFSSDSLIFETKQHIWPQNIMLYNESKKVYIKSLSGMQQQMKNFVHFKFAKE